MGTDEREALLQRLVEGLCAERGVAMPRDCSEHGLWTAFRALVNTRPPLPASPEWLADQDRYLADRIARSGITRLEDVERLEGFGGLRLWRGDITTFAADAIVNAANSQMLGCWVAGHHCIDNAIHTFAGIQLRAECARLMERQGFEEPVGRAKITAAYNLPARNVIHTVGPAVSGPLTERHRGQLASCYRSCLDLAARQGLGSIVFCCISTGIFGFPQREAAYIAVATVLEWLRETGHRLDVVFDVFTDEDHRLYREAVGSLV